MDTKCDIADVSVSDYSIWVRNIPLSSESNADYDDNLKFLFFIYLLILYT